MQSTTGFLKAAVIALSLAATLASCSPSPGSTGVKDAAWVKQQFLDLEAKHTAEGDLFAAIRTSEPELYDKVLSVVGEQINAGKPIFEAGAAARPIYMERFLVLVKTANDDDINDMLDFTKLQMQHLLDMDPKLCAMAVNGEVDARMTKLPRDVLEREMRMMARVIRAGEQRAPTVDEDKLVEWVDAYMADHMDMTEGLELMGTPNLSTEDARKVCLANMTLLDGLLMEPPEIRAPLFRGLLAMS